MKPENIAVNPRSRASHQFTPEIINSLSKRGFEVKYLVMTHNLSPEAGEPSIVIEYVLIAHEALKIRMSREQVLSLANEEVTPEEVLSDWNRLPQPQIDAEVEHPDDYDFRDQDGLETDLPTGGF